MLESARARLRRVEEKDLKLLVKWRNDPEIWKHFFNAFPLYDTAQKAWYEDLRRSQSRVLFVIEDKKSAKPAGTVGLDKIDFRNQSAEFGNLLIGERKFLGRGLAREASSLAVDYAFGHLNLRRVYLYVFKENTAAVKIYEGLGFKREGILREAMFAEGKFKDLLLMSLLKTERKNSA